MIKPRGPLPLIPARSVDLQRQERGQRARGGVRAVGHSSTVYTYTVELFLRNSSAGVDEGVDEGGGRSRAEGGEKDVARNEKRGEAGLE